LPLVGQGCP